MFVIVNEVYGARSVLQQSMRAECATTLLWAKFLRFLVACGYHLLLGWSEFGREYAASDSAYSMPVVTWHTLCTHTPFHGNWRVTSAPYTSLVMMEEQ